MNVYDGGDSAQFSAAPPMAPGALARRVRGRLGNQAHIGALAQLHPNHPIFQKYPALAAIAHRFRAAQPQMSAGIVPQPGPGTVDPPPSHTAPPDPTAPPGSTTTPPNPAVPPGANPYPWMNIPTDLSGLGAEQWGDPASGSMLSNRDPMSVARSSIRQRLMDRYVTARPQQPKLTSKYALNQYLNQAKQRRPGGSHTVLPQRRPMNRPY